MAHKVGRILGALLVLWIVGRALIESMGPSGADNARLDAEIQHALKTTGTYVPPSAKAAPRRPDALWVARVDTLACLSKRSIETIQFLDALGRSEGVRNSASDPSKTDCVNVPAGTRVAVEDWGGEAGIATAWAHGADRRHMISRDIVPLNLESGQN